MLKRILTAAILIPLVLISVFYTSPLTFRLILAAVLLLAAWEWSNLIPLEQKNGRSGYLLLLAVFFYLSSFIPPSIFIAFGIAWWLWVSYRMIQCQGNHDRFFPGLLPLRAMRSGSQRRIFVASTGIFALTILWVSLGFLRDKNQTWVIMLLFIVWIADTAAYFAGQRFGQHFLAPQISPKKTWEGAVGALFAVFAAILFGGWLMGLKASWVIYLSLLGLITVIISIVGDLFESLLKRQAGTKDSGQLLPGHGGLLDRIDSLIAAAPFFAGGVFLLQNMVT